MTHWKRRGDRCFCSLPGQARPCLASSIVHYHYPCNKVPLRKKLNCYGQETVAAIDDLRLLLFPSIHFQVQLRFFNWILIVAHKHTHTSDALANCNCIRCIIIMRWDASTRERYMKLSKELITIGERRSTQKQQKEGWKGSTQEGK